MTLQCCISVAMASIAAVMDYSIHVNCLMTPPDVYAFKNYHDFSVEYAHLPPSSEKALPGKKERMCRSLSF